MNPRLHQGGKIDGRNRIDVLFVCHGPMCALGPRDRA
jgi:hypothetical protein